LFCERHLRVPDAGNREEPGLFPYAERAAWEPTRLSHVLLQQGRSHMDQQDQEREVRIGIGLLFGLAVFALIALGSFYFHPSTEDTIASRIAHSSR
jgi:hypothetical protein